MLDIYCSARYADVGIRSEDTMETGQVDSGFGYQGNQSGYGRLLLFVQCIGS